MRGSGSVPGRGWPKTQPRNEAITQPHTHPSPYGGWNARGNLANMKSDEAIQMDNVFPGVQAVEMRKGVVQWAYGPPDIVNGTFTVNTDGWTGVDCTLAVSAGTLEVTKTNSGAAGCWAYQLVELVPGNSYTINVTISGGSAQLKVGGIPGSILDGQVTGTGAQSLTFTAGQALTYISLSIPPGFGPGTVRNFDNVVFDDLTGNFLSLMPYHGLTTNKLFAATSTDIYDVTANTAIGAAVVSSLTSGYWKSVMMSTSGGNFMLIANGTDSMRAFDGTTWSTPAITVATSSTWNYLAIHKRRLWAIQKNTLDLWYLPVDSIAGAAVKFPVGPVFKKGGRLVAIGTWTLDSGQGIDDLFVICTSNGEIAVYQGTDPASASTWALVAVFDVSRPVGDKPLLDYGGDLLYLGATGILPLSKLRQASIVDSSSNYSYNVDGAFVDAVEDYGSVYGWQMITHKSANLLLVNVPTAENVQAVQFVMNTITRKWARFTNWDATCWADLNGELYFASGRIVSKAWVGSTDYEQPIVGVVRQAYSTLGYGGQKKVELTRPNFGFTGSASLMMAFDTDYGTFGGQTDFSYVPSTSGGFWDSGLWDTAMWDAGVSLFEPKWTTIPGNPGFVHSLRVRISASSGNFTWTSTDMALKGAGIL